MRNHQDFSSYDYFAGITHVRLTEDEDTVDEGNRDYFTLSDMSKISMMTLNHNITTYNSPAKDIHQFLAFNIVGELLCNVTKTYLYHDKLNYCLFDECVDRGNVKPAIENSIICSDCYHLLKKKGVSESVLRDIRQILDWCRRNTGKRSHLYRAIVHPLSSLTIGTAIGWTASAFIKSEQYLYVFIGAVVVPISLYIYYVIKHRKDSNIVGFGK